MKHYDVIVIGGGPAGYVAAIRCAQQGLKTACIDSGVNDKDEASLGGTCLNVGCIPSKALLESSELFERCQRDTAAHGIKVSKVTLELETLMQRKQQVVNDLTSGINALFKVNGIDLYTGSGKLFTENKVEVTLTKNNTKEELTATDIILAPGSVPRVINNIPYTNDKIVDSTAALSFDKVPKRLAIIGAGIIGLELGSVWRRLGAEVTLFEASKDFLPAVDQTIAKQASKIFTQQGLIFSFACQIKTTEIKNNKVTINYMQANKEKSETFDKVFVAVGRSPNTKNVFDPASGLICDEHGFIEVDAQCQTNLAHVYAIGDAVRGPMLAHKGEEEGAMVADLIAGYFASVNYDTIPFVVYTEPEMAWCGKTEQQLKSENIKYKSGTFSFTGNGRARAMRQTQGLIKTLADAKTDRILGVHMFGPHVSELISQAVIAMEFNSSSEDLAMTMFAHPSLSEVFHESAMDVLDRAIHKGKAKKS
ncbi:Dihydrolipoamide dehydrogenase of 2-oxoglutarate dehydrogenase [hydrothermal vent metagenome]|uniref:Dihydrolipoyl dehydrogenase n=1 Tax=hydrothermal vent metagenome TaxID=652676 RepID=A0A3B0ZUK1_9ZZZZ